MIDLFIEVVSLDAAINDATDRGDEQAAEKLYEKQNALVDQIESLGYREQFDEYIKSIT